MSFTPFNAPLLGPMLGDTELAALFSVRADVAAMIRFEAALSKAEGESGVIPEEAAEVIVAACGTFEPDVRQLGEGTARDGVAVPEFVKLLRAHVSEQAGDQFAADVHFGATSQDLIDTSLTLRLRDVVAVLQSRLDALDVQLVDLDSRFGGNPLMGRTRMQAAIPMLASDRLRTWRLPLKTHSARLGELQMDLLKLQFGGAVGTLDKLGDKRAQVSQRLANKLGLSLPDFPWHSDRTSLVELANWLALLTGTLGKLGQDAALMAQNGIDEIAMAGAGGSSAMPHKQNPIKAEALITLARFNAVLASGMHHTMVHEQERSGAAWTLEWMLLPQMVVATGAATRNAAQLLAAITRIGDAAS